MQGGIAADSYVAMTAVPADAGDLDRALIELDIVGLVCVGRGAGSGDCDVDRRIDGNVEVNEVACEVALAAIAGIVAAGRNHVRADQPQDRGGPGSVAADRSVAVSAVAADACHLNRGLIEQRI